MDTQRYLRRLAAAALLAVGLAVAGPGPTFAQVQRVAFGDPALQAYREHRSHVDLTVEGRVIRVLSDEYGRSRHQRFILGTTSGLTLLVVHNVDLAPRIPGLRPGDPLRLHGEYIWNHRGGLLHWTHHDPSGRHQGGYIERAGHRYE